MPEALCSRCVALHSLLDPEPLSDRSETASREPTAAPGRRRFPSGPGQAPPLTAFGDYELLGEIAHGGMGVVYRARQISLNGIVAVKMMLLGQLAGKAAFERFRAEAETVARLQHPNIVAIHQIGETDGYPYFSMDYVEGRNLAEVVRDRPLPARQAAGYTRTLAGAVAYAHSQGILHRDLKPANVLIDAVQLWG
jgi:eukaryotic-like serine/threonine-protein kinase